MRFLIALALLGCTDGTGGPCPSVAGMTPEDWIDPGELAQAKRDGIYGCFVDQRLLVAFNNRCEEGAAYIRQPYAVMLDTCVDQPDPAGGAFSVCWELWASGSCNDIADSTDGPGVGCAGILPALREQDRLACP